MDNLSGFILCMLDAFCDAFIVSATPQTSPTRWLLEQVVKRQGSLVYCSVSKHCRAAAV